MEVKKKQNTLEKADVIKKNLTKKNLRGAEPLVFGHAELFLKARATTALIDHG